MGHFVTEIPWRIDFDFTSGIVGCRLGDDTQLDTSTGRDGYLDGNHLANGNICGNTCL